MQYTEQRMKVHKELRQKLDEISTAYYEAVADCDFHECAVGYELGKIIERIDEWVDKYGEDCDE